MTTLEIHPDSRALLAAHGLDSFDALFAAGESGRIDGHASRSVSRLELRGPDGKPVVIYLKRQWAAAATASWKDLLRLRRPVLHAEREWRNLARLSRAGIAVAPPVAWGRGAGPDGPRALLATRAVEGPSLARWLFDAAHGPAAPPRLRRAVAEALGRAVRRLHDAGFSFPDLYAKHVYLENLGEREPRVVLIDVHRLCGFARWRAARDLAALHASTQAFALSRADRLRVVRAYVAADQFGSRWPKPHTFWGRGGAEFVQSLLGDLIGLFRGRGRISTRTRRNILRRNTFFIGQIARLAARMSGRGQDPNLLTARRAPPPGMLAAAQDPATALDAGRLHVKDAFRPALEAAGLATLDTLMRVPGGKVYRQVPGRSTVRLELAGPDGAAWAVYLKRYTRVPWRLQLRRLLSLNPPVSLAVEEVRNLVRVTDAGIATMRWLALGQELAGRGLRERSCLVTQEISGATQADDYCEAAFGRNRSREAVAAKRRLIRAIADLARRLHAARLSHRDFYLCHILVRPMAGAEPVLHLIDLQRVLHHKRGLGRRWIVKDLAALLFSSRPSPATGVRSPVFTRTDALRFARAYFRTRRLGGEQKECLRAAVRKAEWIARHDTRRRRKGQPT